MEDRDLIARLLDQNDLLIHTLREAVNGANPVGVIRALNPPFVPQTQGEPTTPADPWAADPDHPVPEDPWGDEDIPLDRLRPGSGGWLGRDGKLDTAPHSASPEDPPAAESATEAVGEAT